MRRSKLIPSIFSILCLLPASTYAAPEGQIRIVRPEARIQKLQISSVQILDSSDSGDGLRLKISLQGVFKETEAGWTVSLLKEGEKARDLLVTDGLRPERDFQAELPIRSSRSPMELIVVGPNGELARESAQIEVPDWDALVAEAHASQKRHYLFAAGIGTQVGALDDSRRSSISQEGLDLSGSVTRIFDATPVWVRLDFGVTALAVHASPDTTYRVLAIDAFAGGPIGPIDRALSPSAEAGVTYYTIFSAPNVGYNNVVSPVLAVKLAYDLGARLGRLTLKGGAGPVFGQTANILSLSSHQFLSELRYDCALSLAGLPLAFVADFDSLRVLIQGFEITTQTGTLGARVEF